MAKKKVTPPAPLPLPSGLPATPLPEPWDENEEIDPGWAQLVVYWYDGHKKPLIDALRGHDRIPSYDRVLRTFLADFLEANFKRPTRGRPPGEKTWVVGLDNRPMMAAKTDAKKYEAAAWMRARQCERGDRQRVHALVEAADKFELDVAAFENWLDKPLKQRR